MKPYPKYKDSGVGWLGEIPERWGVNRLKYLISGLESGVSVNATDLPASEGDFGVLKTSCVYNYIFDPAENKAIWPEEISRAKIHPRKGEIIISRMNTPELVGASGYVHQDYPNLFLPDRLWQTIFYDYEGIDTYWLSFILKCAQFKKLLSIKATGTSPSMKNLAQEAFLDISIPLPTKGEQTVIANYLDRKMKEIDRLIANKERLIELYEEEKTAVINHAVTKGRDLGAPMKPSGIDWLGDIPEHWEIKKMKYILDFHDSKRIPLSSEVRGQMLVKEYDYYGASGVIDQVEDYIFDGEYILLGEDGANLLTRSTALSFKAVGKYWVNNHAHILTPKQGNLDYFVSLLENIDYKIWVSGSAQPKLTAEALGSVEIAFPNSEEQDAIVQHIETECSRLDAIIDKFKKQIELLKEYRTTMISEVVTGKIDVRDEGIT